MHTLMVRTRPIFCKCNKFLIDDTYFVVKITLIVVITWNNVYSTMMIIVNLKGRKKQRIEIIICGQRIAIK